MQCLFSLCFESIKGLFVSFQFKPLITSKFFSLRWHSLSSTKSTLTRSDGSKRASSYNSYSWKCANLFLLGKNLLLYGKNFPAILQSEARAFNHHNTTTLIKPLILRSINNGSSIIVLSKEENALNSTLQL